MLLWSITAWSWHPPHLPHSTLQFLGFFSYLSSDHASLRRDLLRKTSGNILDISMYAETWINDVDHHCCMYACQKPHQKIACTIEYHTIQKIACARESHSWYLCATWVGRIFGNPRIGILSPHHCHDVWRCCLVYGSSELHGFLACYKAKQSGCGPWFYALWDDELEILNALQPTSSRFVRKQ